MVDADPSDMENRRNLAATLFNIGDALCATGRIADGVGTSGKKPAHSWRRSDDRDPFDEFVLATAHDLCADLLDKAGRPPLAGDRAPRERHINQALAALRRAIAGGYRAIDPNSFSALRSRPEFQGLMRDLAFPEWPFAGEPPP